MAFSGTAASQFENGHRYIEATTQHEQGNYERGGIEEGTFKAEKIRLTCK